MRILVVQESDWVERGPHQNHHLMERLSERGHTIKVIDFEIAWREKRSDALMSKRIVLEGVRKASRGEVTVIRPAFARLPLLDYVSLIFSHRKEISKQIAEFKPDVIVGFGILNTAIAISLARKAGIPIVYYIIDELFRLVRERTFQPMAKIIETYNMRRADRVVSINDALREYTIRMGADRDSALTIRAGVDKSAFNLSDSETKAMRRSLGANDEDILMLFMGWLYVFSGVKEVADELNSSNQFPNIKLLILGKGDLWGYLESATKEHAGEKRIILVGWKSFKEVPKYILASDVCLLPALQTDIMMNIVPIKMYEYLAAGKPVIATRLPGLLREFGQGNGVVYVNDPRDVLEAVAKLAREGSARDLGAKARRFVEGNDWQKVVTDFEDCLEGVITCQRNSGNNRWTAEEPQNPV